MRRRRSERGSALTATMMAAALLLPLGAMAVFVARSGLLMQQSARAEADAFYHAEAGAEWAVAALPSDRSPALLVAGPDGLAGTADDGAPPVLPPAALSALFASTDIRLSSAGPNLVRITVTATSARQTSKSIERLVRPRADPYAPGALYVDQDAPPIFGSAPFVISGFAHAAGDVIGSPSGSGAPLPALAYGPAAAAAMAAALPVLDPTRFVGSGGPPSLAQVQPIDLGALASRAAARADATSVDPSGVGLTLGSTASPRLSLAATDTTITGHWQGAGVLVVRGRLTVAGTFDFDGLVIATDGIVVDAAAFLHLRGALWLGRSPAETRGGGGVGWCPTCLIAADAAAPGLLPHRYEACGWREVY